MRGLSGAVILCLFYFNAFPDALAALRGEECNAEDNNLFPHDEFCDIFYRCVETSLGTNDDRDGTGVFVAQQCEDGLIFLPEKQDCVLPHKGDCQTRRKIQKAKSSGVCPRLNGLFPRNPDCSKYLFCRAGRPTAITCPPLLLLNPLSGRCLVPRLTPLTFGCFFEPFVDEEDPVINNSKKKGPAFTPFEVMGSDRVVDNDHDELFTALDSRKEISHPIKSHSRKHNGKKGKHQKASSDAMQKTVNESTSSTAQPPPQTSSTIEQTSVRSTLSVEGTTIATTAPRHLNPFEIMGIEAIHDHESFNEDGFVELNDPNKHIVRRSIGDSHSRETDDLRAEIDASEENETKSHSPGSTLLDFFIWLLPFLRPLPHADETEGTTVLHNNNIDHNLSERNVSDVNALEFSDSKVGKEAVNEETDAHKEEKKPKSLVSTVSDFFLGFFPFLQPSFVTEKLPNPTITQQEDPTNNIIKRSLGRSNIDDLDDVQVQLNAFPVEEPEKQKKTNSFLSSLLGFFNWLFGIGTAERQSGLPNGGSQHEPQQSDVEEEAAESTDFAKRLRRSIGRPFKQPSGGSTVNLLTSSEEDSFESEEVEKTKQPLEAMVEFLSWLFSPSSFDTLPLEPIQTDLLV